MLLIFDGLPATGKSTISQGVARELQAVYVRVDSIEQALGDTGFNKVSDEGYVVAYRIAADNLLLGSTVVADSVNPVKVTRDAWRLVGDSAEATVIEIEIVCSDQTEHKQRFETRSARIDGLIQPTWEQVLEREYEPWTTTRIVVDTAGETSEQSIEKTLSLICIDTVS